MRRTATWLTVVLGLCRAAQVDAQPLGDNRPEDRFYLGVHAGVGSGSAESIAAPDTDALGAAFGYDVTFWPVDYVALGYGLNVAILPSGDTCGTGFSLLVAVPLRYVQPYVGGWAGLTFHGRIEDETADIDKEVHLVAGTNVFVNRNVRMFVQWQNLTVDADAGTRGHVVTGGVRFSPDWFHEKRGIDKFNWVWGMGAASVPLFLIAALFVGG